MRQNYNWFSTRYNYYHSEFGNIEKTGIRIEKPIKTSHFENAPHIKAVALEYGGSFKRAKIDFSEYLAELLSVVRLEYLEIKSGGYNLEIPSEVLNSPLKVLEFSSAETLDLSFIGDLPLLESLSINIMKKVVNVPSELLKCTNLKSLSIMIKGGDLSPIYKLRTLEEIKLRVDDLVHLKAFDSERIKMLNVVGISLGQLSSESSLSQLENLTIITKLPLNVPSNYFSNSIQKIKLNGTDIKPELPTVMPNLEHLEVTCDRLPTLNAPVLKSLNILYVKNETVNEILGEVPNLETLMVGAMDDFDCNVDSAKTPNLVSYNLRQPSKEQPILDFSDQEKLAIIEIENGQNVEVQLPIKPKLAKITLRGVSNKVLDLGHMNKTIIGPDSSQSFIERQLLANAIDISNCANLKELKLSENVRTVRISVCEELEIINLEGRPELLDSFIIYGCEKIKRIPAEMLLSKEGLRFGWKASDFEITQKEFSKIVKDLAEAYDERTRLEIGRFIFENNKDFKRSAIAAFSIKSRNVFTLLERSLPLLSKDEIDFGTLSSSEVAGKNITIAGKPHEKKTTIKEQVARVGMKYVTKAVDADYIIVCYTADLDYDENRIYLSEFTFEEYCKKEHPRFLVASASTENVKKLRQIMWSTDPKSENLALEMLKKGGLLEEVIGEAVVISKTSLDPSVKRKYKAFLKGKVSEDWLKIMSSNKRNTYWIPKSALPGYMRAKYKRERAFHREFLHANRVDMEERMDAVKNNIIPEVLARPHYLQLPTLFKTELELILNLSEIKGRLKRLVVILIDEVPANLADHITLKEVTINCPNCEQLPSQIYGLSRLSLLNFSSDALNYVDDKILKLIQLKRIVFSANQPVSLPGALPELPKLKQTVFNGGKVFR